MPISGIAAHCLALRAPALAGAFGRAGWGGRAGTGLKSRGRGIHCPASVAPSVRLEAHVPPGTWYARQRIPLRKEQVLRLSRVLHRAGPSARPASSSLKVKSVVAAAALAVAGAMFAGGCDVKSFIDPAEMGRYQHQTLMRPIISSLSTIDRSIDDP